MSKPKKYGMNSSGVPNNRRPAPKNWKPKNHGREWSGPTKEARKDGDKD